MDERKVTFTCKARRDTEENKKTTSILLLLSMLLNQENKDIKYYAEKLKCKEITVKKYIKEIRASYDALLNKGFCIEYEKKGDYYTLSSGNNFLPLNQFEIESLYDSIRYLSGQTGSPYKHLEEIKEKLQKLLRNELKEGLDNRIDISTPKTKSKLRLMLYIIDNAIKEMKKLIIDYTPTYHKRTVEREIVPFCLLNHDYEWYIRAFCLKDKKIKTYSVNQIVNIKESKELTGPEEDELPSSPELKVEHMWDWDNGKEVMTESTEVRIKFAGTMAQRMKKKLQYRTEHPSQKIESPGEDVIIFFKVKNPFNMLSWILQFGSQAEVIEPKNLRERIKAEVDAIRNLY